VLQSTYGTRDNYDVNVVMQKGASTKSKTVVRKMRLEIQITR
jgi:hypothetical protein